MDTYTLEAGRAIRRNGRPFVSLTRSPWPEHGVSPCDADTFARFIPAAIDALRVLQETHTKGTDAWPAIVAAEHALSLLPKEG